MTADLSRLQQLLRRRPFIVLGYSADDETWCPTCLRVGDGLSPNRLDYDGNPVLPLYAADLTVRDETCCYCHERLLDLVPALQLTRFTVQRRYTEPDSTIARYAPLGLGILDGTGRGALYLNSDSDTYVLEPLTPDAQAPALAATPRPPRIRRHAAFA
jgi:hypothetical protein